MNDSGIDPFALDNADSLTAPAAKPVAFSERSKALKRLPKKEDHAPKLPGIRRETAPDIEATGKGTGVGSLPAPRAPDRAGWDVATRRVYVALTNPKWRELPEREMARRCNMSLRRFNSIRRRPDVYSAINDMVGSALQLRAYKFVDHVLANMALPGRDGHHDRKLFARLTGLERPASQKVEHTHTLNVGGKLAAALERARVAEKQARDPQDVGNGSVIDVTPAGD